MSDVILWGLVLVGGYLLRRLSQKVEAGRQRLGDVELEVGRLERLLGQQERPDGRPAPIATQEDAPEQEAEPLPSDVGGVAATPESPPAAEPPPLPAAAPPPREAPAPSSAPDVPLAEDPSPPRRTLDIDWERWVGVRGAAVLGGVVLALAAILFLKYSIEHGLIPPVVRVALGFLGGGGAIFGSEIMRRRRYRSTADAVAGAGVVILYASVWAAKVLYGLVPGVVAWTLMVLVTLVCGLLSWRRESLVIALLGLSGGFLTPALLSTGSNNPIGLFSYVLLLDGGLLWLAQRRRWPVLSVLSLVGTFFYQAIWIFDRMTASQSWLGLAIVGLFALFFALFNGARARRGDEEGAGNARLTQAAGVLLPFVFALYFSVQGSQGVHLAPVGALVGLLALAATWLGRFQGRQWLPRGAAAATLATVLVWVVRTQLDSALGWELAAVSLGLALAFHWPLELDRRQGKPSVAGAWWAPALATGGLTLWIVISRVSRWEPAALWPWLCGTAVLAALWWRQATLADSRPLRIAVAVVPAVALAYSLAAHGAAVRPPSGLFLGLAVLAATLFQLPAWLGRKSAAGLARRREWPAAIAPFALLTVLSLSAWQGYFDSAFHFFAAILVLAMLAVLVATRTASGPTYAIAVGLAAFGHTVWVMSNHMVREAGAAEIALAAQVLAVLVFTFWPFIAGRRLAASRWALYGAALAGPAWFLPLKDTFVALFGDGAIAVVPLALGAASLVAAIRARRLWDPADPGHKRSLVWFLAVALAFITVAIPLQLDKEWITIGWALLGMALMVLWKRLDHPGLRLFGLALLAAAGVRLLANPEILGYYARSGVPVFNWLMYTYLVPAVALLVSARLQEGLEVERRPPWESALYAGAKPLGAAVCAGTAIVVVFAWINLTIVDAFSTGRELSFALSRLPARDLTLSLAWILFAVALLAIGMVRRSVVLRWISLAFMVLSIGKVFLYDLGELRELYRVASLVGLAVSLLLVSLAYQRFVFGDDLKEIEED